MVASPKYPLEALVRLRDDATARAEKALAREIQARVEREAALSAAEEERRRHGERTSTVLDAEASALEAGRLRVRDLEQRSAFEIRAVAEATALGRRVDESAQKVRDAELAVVAKTAELATRRAEAKLAADHEAKWRHDVAKRAEERAEEEAADFDRARKT